MIARKRILVSLCALLLSSNCAVVVAQQNLEKYQPPAGELTESDGAWEIWRHGDTNVQRRVIELVPQAEPKPALSIQLMPNDFNAKEGNAAIHYLQAMGFFEQSYAQQAKRDFELKNQEAAREEGKDLDDFPPYSWWDLRPEDLPIDQVRDYLSYTSFQPRSLAEAASRKLCDFNRNMRDVENPMMYPLSEIQSMRELARTQKLRFLLALAENRTGDAVEILGQQVTMAYHLNQEPFIVSSLVGMACAGIGLADSYFLCEHAGAPNLYWAIASLPQPLVDLRPAMAYEREFLFEQIKLLREVDASPRSPLYWSRALDEFSESMQGMSSGDDLYQFDKSGMTLMVAAGIPGARRFLHEVEGMSIEDMDKLPNTQVFLLAVRKFYEHARDEIFKWQYATHWERNSVQTDSYLAEAAEEFGLITTPSTLVLPAMKSAMSAQTRLSQQLAYLQTIESVRHHLATHDRQFPSSLADLDLPAPLDPATGKPFQYLLHDQGATLTGAAFPGIRYQFELRCPSK